MQRGGIVDEPEIIGDRGATDVINAGAAGPRGCTATTGIAVAVNGTIAPFQGTTTATVKTVANRRTHIRRGLAVGIGGANGAEVRTAPT